MAAVIDHRKDRRINRDFEEKFIRLCNTMKKCKVGQSFIWPGKLNSNGRAVIKMARPYLGSTFTTRTLGGNVQITRVE